MAKGSKASRFERVYRFTVRLISSDGFFYGIIALTVIQALWYAFSFQPTFFDEWRHLGNIFIYSHHWSPFLGKQKLAWDHYGQIVRDGNFMFYYVMGWFLRLFRLFTSDHTAQIICLRLVCTAFFVGGLVLYRKAFLEIERASKVLTHLSLLFLILTPAFSMLPGAVNYDNLVFLLFAAILFLSVKAVKAKDISILQISTIAIIGLFMTIVKWTSIALFIPVVIYLSYYLYRKYGSKIVGKLVSSVKRSSKPLVILAAVGLLIAGGLFIERPMLNTLIYGNPEPHCVKVLSDARCRNFADYVIYKGIADSKPANFQPDNLVLYFLEFWFPRMINTTVSLMPWQKAQLSAALPVMNTLYSVFALAGVVALLVYIREFLKYKTYQLLLIILFGYCFILVYYLHAQYQQFAVPAALNARYLVPVLPIFIYFVGLSFIRLFGKHRLYLMVAVWCVLFLFTQGGGIVSYSLTAPADRYWRNSGTRTINNNLQQLLHPLVLEH